MSATWREIKSRFNRILEWVANTKATLAAPRHRAVLVHLENEVSQLLNCGEEGVAFEIMVSLFYEIKSPMPGWILDEIEALANVMHFRSSAQHLALDGRVANAIEMIQKLSESERIEQVFVRHAYVCSEGRVRLTLRHFTPSRLWSLG